MDIYKKTFILLLYSRISYIKRGPKAGLVLPPEYKIIIELDHH